MLLIHNKTRDLLLTQRAGIANVSALRRRGLPRHERLNPGRAFGWFLAKRSARLGLSAHSVLELPAGVAAGDELTMERVYPA